MFNLEEWESLAAELVSIPKERRSEIQREAVVFIAGMEQAHGLEAAIVK